MDRCRKNSFQLLPDTVHFENATFFSVLDVQMRLFCLYIHNLQAEYALDINMSLT